MLDVRPADFLAGHRASALNVPVSGNSFATKAGFVLDPDAPIVVQAATADEAERAIRGLRSVGFLDLVGYVLGAGPEQMEAVSLDELDGLLQEGAELIDVREQDERDGGYIAGSRNILYRLLAVAGADVPTDRPVVTICERRAGGHRRVDPRREGRRRAARSRAASTPGPSAAAGWSSSPLRLVSPPRVTEIALFTADVDRVTDFYERVLGVAPADRSEQHAVFALAGRSSGSTLRSLPPRATRRPTTTSPSASRPRRPRRRPRSRRPRGRRPARSAVGPVGVRARPDGRLVELT